MPDTIAILEDNGDRIAAMAACLADVMPGVEIVFFEDAALMIAWLGRHLGQVVLISLDHDLPLRNVAGEMIDCGTGRQVADFLAVMLPRCPVIVHSSNTDCAQGMFFALQEAGWPCGRVYPSDGEAWVAEAWIGMIRSYLDAGWIVPGRLRNKDLP